MVKMLQRLMLNWHKIIWYTWRKIYDLQPLFLWLFRRTKNWTLTGQITQETWVKINKVFSTNISKIKLKKWAEPILWQILFSLIFKRMILLLCCIVSGISTKNRRKLPFTLPSVPLSPHLLAVRTGLNTFQLYESKGHIFNLINCFDVAVIRIINRCSLLNFENWSIHVLFGSSL